MTVVAVGERRLCVGGGPAYLAAARKLSEALADEAGRHELRIAVNDEDPDRVLVLVRCHSPAAFEAAIAGVPLAVRSELAALESGVTDPTWHWYRIAHEIQDMSASPAYVVAIRFRVADVERPEMRAWMRVMMAGAARVTGVVSVARLIALRAVGTVLVVLQYTDCDVARDVQWLLARHPPPMPLDDWARFAGRVDLRWDRDDPSADAPRPGPPSAP